LADLNRQAKQWCDQVANAKPKQSLNMSPAQSGKTGLAIGLLREALLSETDTLIY
jgi:hypothetical protein